MQDFSASGFSGENYTKDEGKQALALLQSLPGLLARGSAREAGAVSPKAIADLVHRIPDAPCPQYRELDLNFSPLERTLWCHMRPAGSPSFTPSLLRELNSLHHRLARPNEISGQDRPLFYVGGSRMPGIFNLGGDLRYFLKCIRHNDKAALTRYAHACVEVGHAIHTGFGAPVITIGLVQGSALGGGLEGALSFHVLVAERGVKMGFPEVLFGCFPGMGAYSFLSRKIGAAQTEKMMTSGRIYAAEEFFEMGIVDVLAPAGEGEAAVRGWIGDNSRRHAVLHAVHRVRQRVNPLTLAEMRDVTDIWVETAMALEESNLRRMERLLNAQQRAAK